MDPRGAQSGHESLWKRNDYSLKNGYLYKAGLDTGSNNNHYKLTIGGYNSYLKDNLAFSTLNTGSDDNDTMFNTGFYNTETDLNLKSN